MLISRPVFSEKNHNLIKFKVFNKIDEKLLFFAWAFLIFKRPSIFDARVIIGIIYIFHI